MIIFFWHSSNRYQSDITVAVILSETTALSKTQGFKATFSNFHDGVSVSEWGFNPLLVNFRVRWRVIEPGRQESNSSSSSSNDAAGGCSLEGNVSSTLFRPLGWVFSQVSDDYNHKSQNKDVDGVDR